MEGAQMKLTNFEPTVAPNNIQGQGNAVSVPSDPRAFGADTSGLEGMGKAVGVGLKLAEDNMTADVTKSMTEYQRRINDLMYNPDTGLAYLKNENARDVTAQYIAAEKKIRDEVFATVPTYKKAQDIFNQKADELTAQGIDSTNRQQYEQGKNYSLSVMNDAIEQSQIAISHNLGNEKLIESNLRNINSWGHNGSKTKGKKCWARPWPACWHRPRQTMTRRPLTTSSIKTAPWSTRLISGNTSLLTTSRRNSLSC